MFASRLRAAGARALQSTRTYNGRAAWIGGIGVLSGVGIVAMATRRQAAVHPLFAGRAGTTARTTASTASTAAAQRLAHLGHQGSAAAKTLDAPAFPAEWPFTPDDFRRYDEAPDTAFYGPARIVHHIDDSARAALTALYAGAFPAGADVLDICSSWVSHFPSAAQWAPGRRVGMGMNAEELGQNDQLDTFDVADLNADPHPSFPHADNTFDVVTCVVSIDYLTNPLETLKEIGRVLKPGGRVIFSQSNRCFPTKAIHIWHDTSDMEHLYIIGR